VKQGGWILAGQLSKFLIIIAYICFKAANSGIRQHSDLGSVFGVSSSNDQADYILLAAGIAASKSE